MPGFEKLAAYIQQEAPKRHAARRLAVPLVSYSTLRINVGNDYHLRHGLWIVNPLADPRLYAYMQTIPLQYCADKLLMRIYAKAKGIPEGISFPEVNEDFRETDETVFYQLKDVIGWALEDSILIKSGWLEAEPLMAVYQRMLAKDVQDLPGTSLIFLNILFAELNLRSLGVVNL